MFKSLQQFPQKRDQIPPYHHYDPACPTSGSRWGLHHYPRRDRYPLSSADHITMVIWRVSVRRLLFQDIRSWYQAGAFKSWQLCRVFRVTAQKDDIEAQRSQLENVIAQRNISCHCVLKGENGWEGEKWRRGRCECWVVIVRSCNHSHHYHHHHHHHSFTLSLLTRTRR